MPNLSMGGTLEEEAEFTDSEPSPTSPLNIIEDKGSQARHSQRYKDTSFNTGLRYDQDTSLQQYHQDISFQFQDVHYQDDEESHQRSVSYDAYDTAQQTGNSMNDDDLKARSAANMGEMDHIVEKYWEVATPPHHSSTAGMMTPPPPAVATPTYGCFLSPDDAKKHTLKRPQSPLSQTAYSSNSPEKVAR
jgi:hypothetical protein